MKTANSLITLILLLTAVFSVVITNAVVNASTENEAVPAQGDYSVLEGDDPNTPEEEHDEDNEEDNTFEVECWNGELVDDVSDCPVDEGNIVCDDGSFALRISDCPTGSSPPEDDGDRNNNGIQDYAEEEDYEANPYMASGGFCHDRKDYHQGGPNDGLYPCNDGTNEEDWRDCKDVSEFDYN